MSEDHSALKPTRNKRELHLPSRNQTMNSLSTSTFNPVAFCLGLLLAMASAFPTGTSLEGDSKDEGTDADKTVKFMTTIRFQVTELRKEMCDKYNKCENTTVALARNNLNLPEMTDKDRCFHSGFNQETCLMKIITGLLEFQIYLDYVQNKFEGEKGNIIAVQNTIKSLVQNLKQKVKNSEAVTTPDPSTNAGLLSKLHLQSGWLKNTTINLILQSLDVFMQYSLRATRMLPGHLKSL
ncbi:interleukin-6 [Orycteropus afer afer]|uniref:Interleukin-6 n=1 Tax=Orycteropus afer afer TaxID=1230840 RepID=A0A8B7A9W6_ORYAF|nr:interleukin-6 [Orycteropus afer afer]